MRCPILPELRLFYLYRLSGGVTSRLRCGPWPFAGVPSAWQRPFRRPRKTRNILIGFWKIDNLPQPKTQIAFFTDD
jgi:hypothetical protein